MQAQPNLISLGCDPSEKAKSGTSPLRIAKEKNHVEIVNYLTNYFSSTEIEALRKLLEQSKKENEKLNEELQTSKQLFQTTNSKLEETEQKLKISEDLLENAKIELITFRQIVSQMSQELVITKNENNENNNEKKENNNENGKLET